MLICSKKASIRCGKNGGVPTLGRSLSLVGWVFTEDMKDRLVPTAVYTR